MAKTIVTGALLASLALVGCGGTASMLGSGQGGSLGAMATGSGSGLSLFIEPDAGVAPVVDAINSAKQSVRMEMYLISDTDVMNALEGAAQRGVKVQVILDAKPYGGPSVQQYNIRAKSTLEGSGVQVHWSNPAFVYTHEKAIVIDGTESLIMTPNMSNSAFTGNREYGLVDTNQAEATSIAAIFDADWNLQTPTFNDPNLVVSPVNSRSKLEALIGSAQQSLLIQDEECFDPATIQLLGQKAAAGVDVRVQLAGPTGGKAVSASEQQEVASLKQAGVSNVKLMTSMYLHGKAVVADGKTAYIGSVNFSANSMDNNREIGLIFTDPSIISTLVSTMQSDWGQSLASQQPAAAQTPSFGMASQGF